MKISLQGFSASCVQSLGPNQKVNLPVCGIYALKGINLDAGGSNASGKSSLLQCPNLALLGPKYSQLTTEDLINRQLNETASAEVSLLIDDKVVEIKRVIGGALSVSVDGKEEIGKTIDIQSKLMQLLRLTPDQLVYLTYKAQEQVGGFLLKDDADKKEFLGSFFDLTDIDKASEICDKTVKDLENRKLSIDSQISQQENTSALLRQQVAQAEQFLSEATSEEKVLKIQKLLTDKNQMQGQVDEVSKFIASWPEYKKTKEFLSVPEVFQAYAEYDAQLNKSAENIDQDRLAGLTTQKQDLQEQIRKQSSFVPPAELTENYKNAEQALVKIKGQLSTKNNLIYSTEHLKLNLSAVQRDLDKVQNKHCDRCDQTIEDLKVAELRQKNISQIQVIEESISVNSKQIEELQEVTESAIKDLEGKKYSALSAIDELKKANDPQLLRDQMKRLDSEVASVLQNISMSKRLQDAALSKIEMVVNTQLSSHKQTQSLLQAQIRTADSEISSMQASVERAKIQHSSLLKTKEDCDIKLMTSQQASSDCASRLQVQTHTASVLAKTGFVGYIFDSILEELSAEANFNLKQIANVNQYSIYFMSDKVTKTTGNVSKKISYVIHDGVQKINFKSLSGGEKLGIIIAVDEALDSILSRRLGVSVDWKCLDEQFTWIDENSKSAIIAFLRNKEKKYLIVDHASEFNASADRVIEVIKKDKVALVSCKY